MAEQLRNPFVLIRCDSCGGPVVNTWPAEGIAKVEAMVCAYNVTLCLACAEAHGFTIKLALAEVGHVECHLS